MPKVIGLAIFRILNTMFKLGGVLFFISLLVGAYFFWATNQSNNPSAYSFTKTNLVKIDSFNTPLSFGGDQERLCSVINPETYPSGSQQKIWDGLPDLICRKLGGTVKSHDVCSGVTVLQKFTPPLIIAVDLYVTKYPLTSEKVECWRLT